MIGGYRRFLPEARCESALPAADLAGFEADFERRVLPAAFAAALVVRSFDPRCVSALPAADFAGFEADFERRVLPAAFADALLVCLPLTMVRALAVLKCRRTHISQTGPGCDGRGRRFTEGAHDAS
jgi:hypothetical protein